MYIIGIDGGGTKTTFGLFYNNQLIAQIEKQTCHYMQVGYDGTAAIIKEGIDELVHQYNIDELKIGIGLAGYGSDANIRNNIKKAIDQQLKDYQYEITSDIHIALLGALGGREGITVIAGTGSIAMALVNGELKRAGGWGYQLGDEGSAYWIGKELLKYFTYQADHLYPRDTLYDAIMNHFHLEHPHQLINTINQLNNQRSDLAALAKLCNDLSSTNEICQNIIKNASKHISLLVRTLAKEYNEQPPISYYGGVFNSQLFKDTFKEELKDFHVIEPLYSPIYGAYFKILK